MKIIANYTRKLVDDKRQYLKLHSQLIIGRLKRNVNDLTKQPYSLEIKVPKSKRSIDQNRLFWEIVGQISKATNIDDMDIYCQIIEMAGAKYDLSHGFARSS